MSRIVYKYPFSVEPVRTHLVLDLPADAKVVLFGYQGNAPTLWIMHSEPRPDELVRKDYVLFGTGHTLPDLDFDLQWVGSAQHPSETLVLHCFEDVTP